MNVNYGGHYAYKEVNYQGGDFRLQWDMMATSVNYATMLPFGMFNSTNIAVFTTGVDDGGQAFKAGLTHEDRGNTTPMSWFKDAAGGGLYSTDPQFTEHLVHLRRGV